MSTPLSGPMKVWNFDCTTIGFLPAGPRPSVTRERLLLFTFGVFFLFSGGFFILTSGTTGISKIVCCPQSALTDSQPIFDEVLRDGDRVGSFWVYYYFLIPIISGCTFVVIPSEFFLKPKELCEYVKRERITILFLTPSILHS